MPKFKIKSMRQTVCTYEVKAENADAAEAAWVESEAAPNDEEIISEEFDSVEPAEAAA